MPNQVDDALRHAMSGSELSRVPTECNQLCILPTVPPHPVQPNSKFPGHGHLGNSFFPTHPQVPIPTSPLWVTPCGRLRCFSQQVAQQRVALLTDMSQPLLAGTGVLTGNQPGVAADLLATRKPIGCPDDESVDQPGDGSHPRMRHQ